MNTFDIRYKNDTLITMTIDAKNEDEALTKFFEILPKATVHGISQVVKTPDDLPWGTQI